MILLNQKLKKKLKNIKFIDLFAGIGGFRIAMESFGAKCVFSSEIDKNAIETYKSNFNDYPAGDIKKINEKDIPNHDILCAGFPCQPFSISGKQKGFKDERGSLFFDVVRIIKEKKPKVFLLENVKNLVSHNNGKTFKKMIKILEEECGYKIYFNILNSSDFNLAQSRKRVYIIGFINKQINFNFPKELNKKVIVKDILEKEVSESLLIKKNNIIWNNKKQSNKIENNPLQIGKIGKGGQGERIYDIKNKSITLSAEGGGPGSKTGIYLVDNTIRKLSPRECARLHGFPDYFKIVVSNNQAWKQFGNTVSVNVLQSIIKEIINTGVFESNNQNEKRKFTLNFKRIGNSEIRI